MQFPGFVTMHIFQKACLTSDEILSELTECVSAHQVGHGGCLCSSSPACVFLFLVSTLVSFLSIEKIASISKAHCEVKQVNILNSRFSLLLYQIHAD